MALITLRSRRDPIEVSNEKAKIIKQRWAGDGIRKSDSRDIVDLGAISFEYGQIKTIEIQHGRPIIKQEDYKRPLTPDEHRARIQSMIRVRKNLEAKGIIRHLGI